MDRERSRGLVDPLLGCVLWLATVGALGGVLGIDAAAPFGRGSPPPPSAAPPTHVPGVMDTLVSRSSVGSRTGMSGTTRVAAATPAADADVIWSIA